MQKEEFQIEDFGLKIENRTIPIPNSEISTQSSPA
jgi:hypothetical protein